MFFQRQLLPWMRSLEKIKSYPPPCAKMHMQRSSPAIKSCRLSEENSSLLANEALANDNEEKKTNKEGQPALPEACRQHSDSRASDSGIKISQGGGGGIPASYNFGARQHPAHNFWYTLQYRP